MSEKAVRINGIDYRVPGTVADLCNGFYEARRGYQEQIDREREARRALERAVAADLAAMGMVVPDDIASQHLDETLAMLGADESDEWGDG